MQFKRGGWQYSEADGVVTMLGNARQAFPAKRDGGGGERRTRMTGKGMAENGDNHTIRDVRVRPRSSKMEPYCNTHTCVFNVALVASFSPRNPVGLILKTPFDIDKGSLFASRGKISMEKLEARRHRSNSEGK
ncbi:hypothetical protein PUN28_011659 [Cardiocondyla obscurior]|uniref:Uncharacterized protein n=1 Tax=Cardiocondyla obscurior TaxID=286306 RepID=A0AAW2FKQ1_9HYME